MLVAQLCPTVFNPTDCSLPGSSVHGILQARILEWVAITLSKLTIVGCLKYPTWWFDKHYEWIPSIKWIQPSPHILCVCMCEREKLTSTLSKFQLHITVWSTLVTILHVKFSTFYSSYYWKFVPFYNSSWLPQPPSLWQPLFSSVSLIYHLFIYFCCCSCSVTKSCPTLKQPHGLQHARLLCLLLSPGVCSDSCQLNQWCYLSISSSAVLLSFCLQSFSTSGSVPLNQLFTSSGQSIGTSASVLPVTI